MVSKIAMIVIGIMLTALTSYFVYATVVEDGAVSVVCFVFALAFGAELVEFCVEVKEEWNNL